MRAVATNARGHGSARHGRRLRVVPRVATIPVPTGWAAHAAWGFCRALGNHAWALPTGLRVVKGQVTVTLTCTHCGTQRIDAVAYGSGLVERRSYGYPKGYCLQLGRGGTRPAKATLRAAYLRQLLGGRT